MEQSSTLVYFWLVAYSVHSDVETICKDWQVWSYHLKERQCILCSVRYCRDNKTPHTANRAAAAALILSLFLNQAGSAHSEKR